MNAINTNLTKLLINSHILIFRVFETAGTLLLYYVYNEKKRENMSHLGNTIILLPYSLILSFIPDGMGVVYTIIAAVSGGLMLAYHYKHSLDLFIKKYYFNAYIQNDFHFTTFA